jgi:hypothetical protein
VKEDYHETHVIATRVDVYLISLAQLSSLIQSNILRSVCRRERERVYASRREREREGEEKDPIIMKWRRGKPVLAA